MVVITVIVAVVAAVKWVILYYAIKMYVYMYEWVCLHLYTIQQRQMACNDMYNNKTPQNRQIYFQQSNATHISSKYTHTHTHTYT